MLKVLLAATSLLVVATVDAFATNPVAPLQITQNNCVPKVEFNAQQTIELREARVQRLAERNKDVRITRIGSCPDRISQWDMGNSDATYKLLIDGSYLKGIQQLGLNTNHIWHIHLDQPWDGDRVAPTEETKWCRDLVQDVAKPDYREALAQAMGVANSMYDEGFIDLSITDHSVSGYIKNIEPICQTLKVNGIAIFTGEGMLATKFIQIAAHCDSKTTVSEDKFGKLVVRHTNEDETVTVTPLDTSSFTIIDGNREKQFLVKCTTGSTLDSQLVCKRYPEYFLKVGNPSAEESWDMTIVTRIK